jgi:hypothetical protein
MEKYASSRLCVMHVIKSWCVWTDQIWKSSLGRLSAWRRNQDGRPSLSALCLRRQCFGYGRTSTNPPYFLGGILYNFGIGSGSEWRYLDYFRFKALIIRPPASFSTQSPLIDYRIICRIVSPPAGRPPWLIRPFPGVSPAVANFIRPWSYINKSCVRTTWLVRILVIRKALMVKVTYKIWRYI